MQLRLSEALFSPSVFWATYAHLALLSLLPFAQSGSHNKKQVNFRFFSVGFHPTDVEPLKHGHYINMKED